MTIKIEKQHTPHKFSWFLGVNEFNIKTENWTSFSRSKAVLQTRENRETARDFRTVCSSEMFLPIVHWLLAIFPTLDTNKIKTALWQLEYVGSSVEILYPEDLFKTLTFSGLTKKWRKVNQVKLIRERGEIIW